MVNIEINNKKIQVSQGAMIIEAADEAGITIPRFCYHKKLSIAANCRMCLVEVEKAPKPLPACATPVTEGMKVFTCSEKAKSAQQSVMEFLLINHPLDCPICDQGGQCELQDVALEFGKDASRYTQGKRSVKDKDIGPLIATEMTRCIHCTRCVRFGEEVSGIRELGATGRGEHMEIGTYIAQSVDSELSGNVVDLCPVGALTSKPFRFNARAWELRSRASIAAHDCVGSNTFVHSHRGKVVRAIPRENENINETWLSDRDRYSYEAVNSTERLLKPQIKQNGHWKEVEWLEALEYTAQTIQNIITDKGPEQLGVLASTNNTVEDLYCLQKLMREKGCHNIDHRLQIIDTSDQERLAAFPVLGRSIASLEDCDSIFIIGGDVRVEQPLINHRIRKATLKGGQVYSLGSYYSEPNYDVSCFEVVEGGDYLTSLAAIVKALLAEGLVTEKANNIADILRDVKVEAGHTVIAKGILSGEQKAVLLGTQVLSHPYLSQIRYLANLIAELSGATIGELHEGANAAGAWLAGMVPHRGALGEIESSAKGLSATKMLNEGLSAYFLLNIEPEFDCINPKLAHDALLEAEHVIMCTPYVTETMKATADILLPIALPQERAGTFVNCEGNWQTFEAAVNPLGEAKPAWKIFRVLGNLLKLSGFSYNTTKDVVLEMTESFNKADKQNLPQGSILSGVLQRINFGKLPGNLIRLAPKAPYSTDNTLRRSKALQQTNAALRASTIKINPATAKNLNFVENSDVKVVQDSRQSHAIFSLSFSEHVPENCIVLPQGLVQTQDLGAPFGAVELQAI